MRYSLASRPLTRGRGLKPIGNVKIDNNDGRPLTRGRGLKLSLWAVIFAESWSPPYTGAWIQTFTYYRIGGVCADPPHSHPWRRTGALDPASCALIDIGALLAVDNGVVARGGFEPPKGKPDRFTVCCLWPLGNLAMDNGAGHRTRTYDRRFTKPLLYQLS